MAAGRPPKLDMGGILNGGLYARMRSMANSKSRGLSEWSPITRTLRMIRWIIDKHSVIRRVLNTEFAGQALVVYLEICNRCVVNSATPSRTTSLMEEIRSETVPQDC